MLILDHPHKTAKHYTIDYWYDEKEGELHITFYQNNKIIHTKDIFDEFNGKEDQKLSCLEVALRQRLTPALFEDQPLQYFAP